MKQYIEQLLQHADFREGECWRVQRFPANAEIVRQGELRKTVYWVKSGRVRVLGHVDVSEDRQVKPGVCDLEAGEMFGELALFDNQPRSASVVAIDDCEVIEIDGERLMDFLETHSELGFAWLKALMEVMVQRLRKSDQKIFSLLAWGLKAHQIDEHLK